ncbi:MAG TPA: FkbM family methyltransferase [Stellaceae bacterium]|jgi:FkbM family methyltransferase
MQTEPYRWRPTPGYAAHLWKAVTQQHHRELLPLFRRLIPRDGVVVDVGAHAGQFAKLFARCAASGRVYAIEPSAYARSILTTVVRLHRLGNISILPVALGAETRESLLSTPIKASGSHGFGLAHLGEPESRWQRVVTEAITETTLDALSAELKFDRLDFIKADIEGNEMRLLVGARETIARFRPRLLVELNDAHLARAGDTMTDAFALMAGLGYRALTLGPDGGFSAAEPGSAGDFWFLPAE